jgi:hypothetical protein
MARLHDRPWYRLTRHFFGGLFDFGFLGDVAVDAFKRMLIGIVAVLLTLGLLLTRMYMAKYASLSDLDTPDPYRMALLADHLLLIALPMWTVAFATVLVGHAVFPDETDFRVLVALPVTRRLIFGAKLAAVALFTGLFAAAAHAALMPLLLVMSMNSWAEHIVPVNFAAYLGASALASTFAVLAITALHGLLVLWVPRGRLLTTSAAMRSILVCALVVSLAFVFRLPAMGRPLADGASWLGWIPPAWFLGVERVLLGDGQPHMVRLAQFAAAAFAVVGAAAAASYAVLYRHFDRVMQKPAESPESRATFVLPTVRARRRASRPVFDAIRSFTLITLRRSVMHQGIVVALSAVAVGLVTNTFVNANLTGWLVRGGPPRGALVAAVVWAPFVLIFAAGLATRMALAVPIEPRANWVFRTTERDASRPEQLAAAVHTVRALGVFLPIALLAPIQVLVVGVDAIVLAGVTLLCGWFFVEFLMRRWWRIPFTCSYIPGKGFVPQTVLSGLFSFIVFTTFGATLAQMTRLGVRAAFVFDAFLLVAILVMRRTRMKDWTIAPLEFEDELPSEVNPLKLSPE